MTTRQFMPVKPAAATPLSLAPVRGGLPDAATRLSQAVLRSPGQALDGDTRVFMERQLGCEPGRVQPYRDGRCIEATRGSAEINAEAAASAAFGKFGPRQDFSGVRVHSDTAAAASAQAHGAAAYAVGHHLVFGHNRYRPDTLGGLRLLAHELAHLTQQGRENRQSLDRFEARVHESAERVGLTEGGAMTNEEATAVYFGNWMRDMNQVFVPLLTDLLPTDVLFSLISYMAATKFGRELTPEQFGYYIPAEHLDNPAGLVAADDLLTSQPAVPGTARPASPARLGAPRPSHLDTQQESVNPTTATVQGVNLFAVDQTGVMAYLRRSNLHVERRLELAASAGRNPDGMHHLGAALHAVEDLFAHSNYVEIAVDRLLRTDSTFLQDRTGTSDRQVFTYSPRASLPATTGQAVEQRPVLTTGSFTGPDTQISLSSELVGVLSRPLPEPATNEEQHAQDRLMVAMLRNFEARLRGNAELRQLVRNAAREAGLPGPLAERVDQVPLADIYQLQTILSVRIPDAIRIPMKRAIRNLVSREVLQPVAGQVQAAGLEARVADTSLIQVLRESQRQERGALTAAERSTMRERERLTGHTVARQEADLRASGARRVQSIQGAPMHAVAGPSHSQLAKDHPNSPFFGLAFRLAEVAVQRIRDRMLEAWANRRGSATTAFDFEWSHFPAAAPPGLSAEETRTYEEARRLYHTGRPARGGREVESRRSGTEILAQGGVPGQPFDLATMRHQAAERIRSVANALRGLTGAPDATARAIAQIRRVAGALVPEVERRLREQLTRAQARATAVGASTAVAGLNAVATTLSTAADAVEAARRHAQREQANAALVAQRQTVLDALATRPGIDTGASAALLYILDQEIQATAVAYSSEQRAVLEGRQSVPEMGASPRGLTVATLTLPPLTGSPATVALMTEARTLMAHPYDNTWWETHVRNFARQHHDQLVNDIEARNEGVTLYRGSASHTSSP